MSAQLPRGANILLVSPEGNLLMQWRDDKSGIMNPGKITAFGGSVEPGETMLEAAVRELEEETRIQVRPDQLELLGIYELDTARFDQNTEVGVYVLRGVDEPTLKVYEGQGKWVVKPGDDLGAINFSLFARQAVADFWAREAGAPIRAVVFDVGGVLQKQTTVLEDDLREELDLSEAQMEGLMSEVQEGLGRGTVSELELWQRLARKLRIRRVLPSENLLGRALEQTFSRQEAVYEIVEELKHKGLTLAVLSNTVEPHARVFRRLGRPELFDQLFFSYEVGMRKPEWRIYWRVADGLGLRPYEVVFVDDDPAFCEAARELGFFAITFRDARDLRKRLHDLKGLL